MDQLHENTESLRPNSQLESLTGHEIDGCVIVEDPDLQAQSLLTTNKNDDIFNRRLSEKVGKERTKDAQTSQTTRMTTNGKSNRNGSNKRQSAVDFKKKLKIVMDDVPQSMKANTILSNSNAISPHGNFNQNHQTGSRLARSGHDVALRTHQKFINVPQRDQDQLQTTSLGGNVSQVGSTAGGASLYRVSLRPPFAEVNSQSATNLHETNCNINTTVGVNAVNVTTTSTSKKQSSGQMQRSQTSQQHTTLTSALKLSKSGSANKGLQPIGTG